MVSEEALDQVEEYRKHLSECEQCGNNPLDPCPVGAGLVPAAGVTAFDDEARR